MQLTVKLGTAVLFDIFGFDAVDNPAKIKAGASVSLTSNDETVATVPATVEVPSDTTQITGSVTVLGVGATDIHCTVMQDSDLDSNPETFESTATLIVEPTPEPGLVRISLELRAAS